MSYLELFHLISKPWASINEIRLIANCGRDSAIKIRNNIENNLKKEGKLLPKSKTIVVPMKYVIDYLGLDVNYIMNMAQNELKFMANNNDNNRTMNYAGVSISK